MLSGLITNVAISAVAFFAVSVVGLLIVPVLIGAYGLAGFGLIAIGRLFLPTTALAVLDLGYGEIATHSVATSRVTGDWSGCARRLGLNVAVAGTVGLAAGIGLFTLASWIPGWCRVPAEHQPQLTEVLRVTAVLLPVLLCSLVAEGVLKGFESFGVQRLIEVVSALAYAGGALWAAGRGLDFHWVCYALLGSLLLRAGLATGLAAWDLRAGQGTLARWTATERGEFFQRARGLFQSKLLGVAQAHSPSFLITILFGPVALGAFDALSRMPRFAKSVLGLLSSTVQPVAARLEQLTDEQGLARLGRLGLILVAAIAAPVLGLAVAFSEPLLRVWLGPDISSLWGWQAAYFIGPTLGALVSFGGSALLGRMSALAAMNRASLVNVAVIVFAGLALSPWLSERAFIASQVAAALVSVPWHLSIIAREIGLQRTTFFTVARIYAISLLLALPVVLVVHRVGSPVILVLAMAGWTIVCWMICLGIGLPASLRARVVSTLAARLRARP
ncbi:MAG: hypothetical protein WCI59_05410 [Betaproteobacteria bacterium]